MKPATTPCAECPWRNSNRGRRHSHGWYSLKNVRKIWTGLRTGNAPGMTCHPTDPSNIVPEGGGTPAPEGNEPTECAGSLLLIQRELAKFMADMKGYDHRRRCGLTKEGMLWWGVSRGELANTMIGGPSMPMISEDPDIQLP